eukprot:CAMPEP_0196666734 /NCGR_PEP_ID=MMETSP1086-20130531/64686_1 /TAXON_ID=77921 /ORGANISM="Cyanoptyche  gloeocystis , Strain SAG4.97" /LENGTH=98 /DNA_ID=CAMNT_0042003973 /DNA_START=1214 /DNA_END=1507 /DNA_ORIENTATION=+
MVNEAVVPRLFWGHEVVPLGVPVYVLECASGLGGHQLAQALLVVHNLLRLNIDVGGLSLSSTQRLMDHNSSMPHRVSFPFLSSTKKEGTHAGRETEAD